MPQPRNPIGVRLPLDLGEGVRGYSEDAVVVLADAVALGAQNQVVQRNYTAVRSQAINVFDSPAVAADAWAQTFTARAQANYRGSYSLNANAADQESVTTADAWASLIAQRAAGYYAPPAARTSNVFDPDANTFADWTPPPTQSRPNPNYSSARSSVTPPSDTTAALDTWAATTFGRQTPYYRGPRAITISVWDPATNTFADWTPAALLSRAVKAYAPPATQPRIGWGESVITDQFAPLMLSRAVPYYRAPLAQPRVAWGESIVTDAYVTVALSRAVRAYAPTAGQTRMAWGASIVTDAWVAAALSRSVPLFRSPAAFLSRVYDQPFVASGTDYVAPALSRRAANYRGSYSAVMGAADQATPAAVTEWAATFLSRSVANYSEPGSFVIGAADEAIPLWTTVTRSREVAAYSEPGSFVIGAADEAIPLWAQVSQARAAGLYRAPLARVISVFDPARNTFADWTPAALLSRQRANYAAPGARVVPVFFDTPVVFGTTWASVYQSTPSRIVRLHGGGSLVFFPIDNPAAGSNMGGGGEWVIWERPDFPGNRKGAWRTFNPMDFKRPSRRERRGY